MIGLMINDWFETETLSKTKVAEENDQVRGTGLEVWS